MFLCFNSMTCEISVGIDMMIVNYLWASKTKFKLIIGMFLLINWLENTSISLMSMFSF